MAAASLLAALPAWQWALCLAAAAALVLELRVRWLLRGVPRTRGLSLPLIGRGHAVARHVVNDTLVDYMHEEAKRHDFRTVAFHIFGQKFAYAVTPEHVRHMFGPQFLNYVKGDLAPYVLEILGDPRVPGRGSIFNTDGEQWKAHRHMASHLFTARQLRVRMTIVFERRGRQLVGILRRQAAAGGSFDLQRLLFCYTFDVINEVAFGREVNSMAGDKEDIRFQAAFDAAQACTARRVFCPPPVARVLRRLGVGSEGTLWRETAVVDAYLQKVIAEREERDGEGDTGDGSDLIALFQEQCTRDGRGYAPAEVRDLILSFMLAGRDTTASLLTHTFYLLCRHPSAMERLRRDVVDHDGDYDAMRWAQAVLLETLRLYPSVPLNVKQTLRADTMPCGARLPAGTLVFFNPYSVNRNPDNFADPDSFVPERWLDADGSCRQLDLQGFTFPTFNAGPRVCLGRNMALLEAKVVLAHVAADFDVALEKGFVPRTRFTVVLLNKNGLRVVIRERPRA